MIVLGLLQGLEAWQHQKIKNGALGECCCTCVEVSILAQPNPAHLGCALVQDQQQSGLTCVTLVIQHMLCRNNDLDVRSLRAIACFQGHSTRMLL